MSAVHTFTFTRKFKTRVDPTDNVKACAAMFGIGVSEDIDIVLYENLPITLGRKRIVYITGDSGAGKSCLLRDVMSKVKAQPEFTLCGGGAGTDCREWPQKPLIDMFDGYTIQGVCELLSFVGIAEAFVYLRKPQELSDGQRYRFMLAQAIYQADRIGLKSCPVICIDEFLAFLDRPTAINVAYQTRRVANRFNLCFVVATTHADIGVDLQPNTTIRMELNMPPTVTHKPMASLI